MLPRLLLGRPPRCYAAVFRRTAHLPHRPEQRKHLPLTVGPLGPLAMAARAARVGTTTFMSITPFRGSVG